MSTTKLFARLAQNHDRLNQMERQMQDFITDNSELVQHIANNWAMATTPGFRVKIFIIRMKRQARIKLVNKYIRAILNVNSNFVMDVPTVKNWRDGMQSWAVKFGDEEILNFYRTIIALRHDPEFTTMLRNCDVFFLDYFLSKVSFIEVQMDLYQGRAVSNYIEYPLIASLASKNQNEINDSLRNASNF